MPNYIYRCTGCGNEITIQRPIAERDEPTVPHRCNPEGYYAWYTRERAPSAPGFKVVGGMSPSR